MQMQWQLIDLAPADAVQRLAAEMQVRPLIARMLINRGIEDSNTAEAFFHPDFALLHDPYLMTDMDRAVVRVVEAIRKKEPMVVYGDYDVDGVTGTSMLVLALRELGHTVPFFIPDRQRDGYGLSPAGIKRAQKLGVSLILAVDCGVTAIDEIALARKAGIDVVVCDHHQPEAELPCAHAVLNPKRSDCPYPFKELSGVGVAFKLLQGVYRHMQREESLLRKYMDLVAIGSAADIVPLVDENRIFVRAGLEQLNRTENLGLRALLEVSGLRNTRVGSGQVVFILAPRINAVGRMGDASRAANLLMTTDSKEAMEIAQVLESENRQRRAVDDETFQSAIEQIQTSCDPENDAAFVLHAEGWHPGVIGIVASRVVEKYYRPTVMIAGSKPHDGINGVGKGSARSIPGFDIHHALKQCEDLMLAFGGHKYAAGLTIRTDRIDALRERLQKFAAETMTAEMRLPKLQIEGEVRFSEIDAELMHYMQLLAPFGPHNMRPVFMSRKVRIVGSPRVVGNNHLRFKAAQDNRIIDAIGFNLGHLAYRLNSSENNVEIAYLVEENEWQGQISTQLRIKDIR
jgi:single-stranded-DNA-specific exonuclease